MLEKSGEIIKICIECEIEHTKEKECIFQALLNPTEIYNLELKLDHSADLFFCPH